MNRPLLVLALCVPVSLYGEVIQQGGAPQGANSKFVLFIHAGPKATDDPVIKQIAGTLAQKGYLVRAPDREQDNVGGPGVDYFADSALATAQDVANTVNEILQRRKLLESDNKKLKPRLQHVKSPPGYLGVWLF